MKIFQVQNDLYITTDEEMSDYRLREVAENVKSLATRIMHFGLTDRSFRKAIPRVPVRGLSFDN